MPDVLPSRDERDWLPTDWTWTGCSGPRCCTTCTRPTRHGLVRDKTICRPCSIAAVGMALATLPVVVERGLVCRPFAAKMAGGDFRFLHELPQVPSRTASGYKRLLLPLPSTSRAPPRLQCELSTIDSAFLFAGMLTAALLRPRHGRGGRGPPPGRRALPPGRLNWARNGGPTLTHGWRPEAASCRTAGGYDEGLLLYVLGLGSPTYPLPRRAMPPLATTSGSSSTAASCSTPGRCSRTSSRTCGSTSAASATPSCATAAATTSKTAAGDYVQAGVCGAQPDAVRGLGEHCWGFNRLRRPGLGEACRWAGRAAVFDYFARGAPFGPDDGTVARGRRRLAAVRPGDRHPDHLHLGCLKLGGQDRQTASSRRSTRPSAWKTAPTAGG